MFKKILVPLDFSKPSLRALDYAVELCRAHRGELVLVHAVETIYYAGLGEMYGQVYDSSTLMQEFAREARDQLERIAADLRKKRLRVSTLLEIGTAPEVIVQAAKRSKADVIVISTHGRTGLAHVFLGSVSERVVRHAGCAVLTVRGLKKVTSRKRTAARKLRRH